MKKLFTVLSLIILFSSIFGQNRDNQFEVLIRKCSDFNSGNYRINPYLKLAIYIQTMDKNKALEILKEYAKTGKYEDQIIVVIKMFFKGKANTTLRRPLIGGAGFLGNTDYKDWPNEPIEIIDNIPFLITRGYSLGGKPEQSVNYLEYCIKNGEWSSNKYNIKKDEELKLTLKTFLSSKKWHIELSKEDKEFFENQIK
ncbi:MAG: hypothetical protein A2275_04095 [Bacteroidetes bacterium RIFOXYA12_FULL_35_11]|nr:MAG: hypothetical protein A2X01_10235 [Bacteroidetes bacterium GWF2_35_48]OFY81002.1 MAG: hypothetical protein A2275_04095 [Bacteroidetes bacterium RIFOXYA12_FULL_35_11]OFY94860.1 MAG: hypothetical protein A2491_21935 [Bacteroidetes bacterium RIFOXYC12_FULL_35_7]HBX49975.1 hypothetical protein [Bacteroidales bacterium]